MQRHTANLDDAGKKQALNDARHQESGTTALMGLASKCAAKCVRWALELGADVAPRNRVGRTALDYAAEQGNVQRTIFLEKWAENYDKSVKAPANRAEMQEYRQLFRDFVKAPGRDTTYGMEQDDEGRYFGAPEVINALIDAGAKLGHTGGYNAARKDDRIFMDNYRCPWFVPEKQPCYEQWKILYELDEENPKGFDHGFRHQDLKASPTLRPVR
ncbi:hypothetical protein M406DRAFT_355518 [Cryphonectria parasitica EP155]|uniref:Ankyrin repeat protein n=1 Tax=Cryphonectria parasitica (strain ATCC 38755 / EP155) TaxID=660469 RepID=A0A9P4Y5W5_CRYP1|nr:uncharacterized protein M406DRAFT_355518 [Cryphonectria parasitica EP155]KAF3767281.1 hypothetical protein M406DRAFT_355518 [Cryphonectria parasitica EP155]